MIAIITQMHFPLDFILKIILIYYCRSQTFELRSFSCYLYVMILSCILVTRK
jgi:hypothetical protein